MLFTFICFRHTDFKTAAYAIYFHLFQTC